MDRLPAPERGDGLAATTLHGRLGPSTVYFVGGYAPPGTVRVTYRWRPAAREVEVRLRDVGSTVRPVFAGRVKTPSPTARLTAYDARGRVLGTMTLTAHP